MLAVAPRGRLSWIPNISGARMLRASLLQLSRKNKKKKKQKKSSRKNVIYRTERGFWTGDIFFTRTSRSKTRRRGRRKTRSLKFCWTFRLICRFNSTFQGRNFFKFLRRFFFLFLIISDRKKGRRRKREKWNKILRGRENEGENSRVRTANQAKCLFSFPQREEERGGGLGWRGEERRRNSQPCGPTGLDGKTQKPHGSSSLLLTTSRRGWGLAL